MFPHHLMTDATRAAHDREREEARRRRTAVRIAETAGGDGPVGSTLTSRRGDLSRRVGLGLVRLGSALSGASPASAPGSPRR